jgi:ribosomal protein S12 methylthiotransferase accessory factor YcaO
LFYPQHRYAAPPEELLLRLRVRIFDRQFESVEKQLDGLFAACEPNPGLYHLRALLETAQGRAVEPVTTAAARELSAADFNAYERLLKTVPAYLPEAARK